MTSGRERFLTSNEFHSTYLGFVDMVVSAGIGTTDGHDDEVTALDEIIVDWGLQLVGMLLDPFAKVDGKGNHCEGVYKG